MTEHERVRGLSLDRSINQSHHLFAREGDGEGRGQGPLIAVDHNNNHKQQVAGIAALKAQVRP